MCLGFFFLPPPPFFFSSPPLHSSASPISFSLVHFTSFQVIQRTSATSSSCSENYAIKLKQAAKSSRQLVLMGKPWVLSSLFSYLYFVWHSNWIKQIIMFGKVIGWYSSGWMALSQSVELLSFFPLPCFLCNPKKLRHCTDKYCGVEHGTKYSKVVWPIMWLWAHAIGSWEA